MDCGLYLGGPSSCEKDISRGEAKQCQKTAECAAREKKVEKSKAEGLSVMGERKEQGGNTCRIHKQGQVGREETRAEAVAALSK